MTYARGVPRIIFAFVPGIVEGSHALDPTAKGTSAAFIKHVLSDDGDARAAGHVKLPRAILNPLALGGSPSPASLLLGLSDKDLWRVSMYQRFVVLHAGSAPVRFGQLLTEDDYADLASDHESLEAAAGPGALPKLLDRIDFHAVRESGSKERAALLDRYADHDLDPSSVALTHLPVVPRAFRHRDLDQLYQRVVTRVARLWRFEDIGAAPVMVVRGEYELLTREVEHLFVNGRAGRTCTRPGTDQPMFSLSDLLAQHDLDVAPVFSGHVVEAAHSLEVAAVLRGVGLRFA